MEKQIAEEVDRLLHDAERAFGGHEMARNMGDLKNSKALLVKAAEGFAHALRLDPKTEAPAWEA